MDLGTSSYILEGFSYCWEHPLSYSAKKTSISSREKKKHLKFWQRMFWSISSIQRNRLSPVQPYYLSLALIYLCDSLPRKLQSTGCLDRKYISFAPWYLIVPEYQNHSPPKLSSDLKSQFDLKWVSGLSTSKGNKTHDNKIMLNLMLIDFSY